jgi:hypothetical protein
VIEGFYLQRLFWIKRNGTDVLIHLRCKKNGKWFVSAGKPLRERLGD